MSIVKEFKEFAMKGNMIDMAVGIVIGAAFGAVVQSLVKDLITPPLGLLTAKVDFTKMGVVLREADEAAGVSEVRIAYGSFLNSLLSFLIIAIAIFLVIRGINRLRRQFDEQEDSVAPTTKKCDHCRLEIPLDATKCGHCTADLGGAAA